MAKIQYPKHVWSPAGGWYCNPKSWRKNTAIMSGVLVSIVAAAFMLSAEREQRHKFPEKGRFYPSRYWSRQILEHERQQAQQQ